MGDVKAQYKRFLSRMEDTLDYADAHCSVLFPELFELHLRDLNYLGLVNLQIIEISKTQGHEFFVHLRHCQPKKVISREEFDKKREELLRAVSYRVGITPFGTAPRWQAAEGLANEPADTVPPAPPSKRGIKSFFKRMLHR